MRLHLASVRLNTGLPVLLLSIADTGAGKLMRLVEAIAAGLVVLIHFHSPPGVGDDGVGGSMGILGGVDGGPDLGVPNSSSPSGPSLFTAGSALTSVTCKRVGLRIAC